MATVLPYRYYLTVLNIKMGISPLLDTIKYVTEKEKDQFFYRMKMEGKLLFKGNDYKSLIQIEDSSDRCTRLGIIVEEWRNTQYEPFYKGTFALNDCEFDRDRGEISIPVSIDDAYRPIMENWGKEYNILQQTPVFSPLNASINTGNLFEFVVANDSPDSNWGLFAEGNILYDELFNSTYKVWFREYRFTQSDGVNPVVPPGSGWELDSEAGSTARWVRIPSILGPPFNTGEVNLKDNDIVLFGPLTFHKTQNSNPPDPPGSILVASGGGTFPLDIFWTVGKATLTRGRSLLETIRWLGGQMGSAAFDDNSQTFSEFFTADINYVTGLPNKLKGMQIFQKSDVKRNNSTEAATKGMISFKSLMEDLRFYFDVHWFINEEGKFRIEHRKYFEETTAVKDLTIEKYRRSVNGMRKYKYQKSKMPRFQKYTVSEASNDDFAESVIEYFGNCVTKTEGEDTQEIAPTKIVTDLQGLILSPGDFSDAGFVLLLNEDGNVPFEVGKVSGVSLPNGHLSIANLLEAYHLYGRIQWVGTINEKEFEFLSVIRTKEQVPLTIQHCIGEQLIPNAKYITALSEEGELMKAEFTPHTMQITYTIVHEGSGFGLPPSNLSKQFDQSFDNSFA